MLVVTSMASFARADESVMPGEEIISKFVALGVALPAASPPRGAASQGPFETLVIRNVNMIEGPGAPTRGPVNIVIKQDKIVEIVDVNPLSKFVHDDKTKVIDATGQYVLPGFVDAHVHLGSPYHAFAGALTDAEYVNKLWLAHGVTTVRDVGAMMGLEWTLAHKQASDKDEIAAPRMVVFPMFPQQHKSVDAARKWVRTVKKNGADGIKFLGAAPELVAAAIDEAKKLGMRTTQHHAQLSVTRLNVLDSARMGLNSMEHWYGLPEALFDNRVIQDDPNDYNYNNEQDRFSQAGRLWLQAAKPGSDKWNAVMQELLDLDFTLDPTFTIYEANRDLMREEQAIWHNEYTLPHIKKSFAADPHIHGSYFFDWTTSDEIAWKKNFARWMEFVNEYKNRGGRVTVGSDSGFIWKIYGFGYVRELELLQEAGFHPLEVVKAATIDGAELLGLDDKIGSIQIGKTADLVIVNENPLANFKVLYGTAHKKLNKKTNSIEKTKGIIYTIKNGVVFDAQQLLAEVRQLVKEAKAKVTDH